MPFWPWEGCSSGLPLLQSAGDSKPPQALHSLPLWLVLCIAKPSCHYLQFLFLLPFKTFFLSFSPFLSRSTFLVKWGETQTVKAEVQICKSSFKILAIFLENEFFYYLKICVTKWTFYSLYPYPSLLLLLLQWPGVAPGCGAHTHGCRTHWLCSPHQQCPAIQLCRFSRTRYHYLHFYCCA